MFSSFKLMTPIVWLTRLLVGAYPHWQGCAPSPRQRIYFANHTSHLDTIVIWASLPPELRRHVHPVAAKDYWSRGAIRRRIAINELRCVLIDRRRADHANPLDPLRDMLRTGDSLIIFPRHSSPASRAESLQVRHLALDDGIPACGIYSGLYREPPPRYA